MRVNKGIQNGWVAATIALGVTIAGFHFVSSTAHAQCTPLTSHVCKPETSWPHDYSFTQNSVYWAVVGVIPTSPDDKDIYVYPSCGSGSPLASSVGVSGTDFVVGDFNHNPLGTYYPRATYGDASAFYNVYWRNGGSIFPIGSPIFAQLGGSGVGCDMIQIYDVYLIQDTEYRISFHPALGPNARAALFRNPSNTTYWAGRSLSQLEISSTQEAYYVAPATDWYGLVVFPTWNLPVAEDFGVYVEKLYDCIPLESGVCVNKKLYSIATGPANDYRFTQPTSYWSVVSILPDTLDRKAIGIYSDCDGNGNIIWSASAGVSDMQFIVGDFNHNPNGEYFARVEGWDPNLEYSLQWDDGPDIFPVPGEITGQMSGLDENSVTVKIWDVYLEAGKQYEFFFFKSGQKDPHLALFRNPVASTYWASRGAGEWEMSSNGYQNYTAPQTDWYGLAVFADDRKPQTSNYQIQIQQLNDCETLTSGLCEVRAGWPRDFSFNQSDGYWAAVALCPSEIDTKSLSVHTQCDGKGTMLAYSSPWTTCLVVADFNHTTTGWYYPRVSANSGEAPWTIAWDSGTDNLPLDTVVEGSVGGVTGECGLVRMWDLYLTSGLTYQIGFTTGGSADVRLALFRNPGSGAYWADRSMAVSEWSESGNYAYTAPATDYYGLVVFADKRGAVGSYSIRVSNAAATAIDAEPTVPERFALYQNTPNPFNPTTTIRYDVPAGGGRVRIDIYDVNGRLVRALVDREETPGERSIVWNGMDERGASVATGIYFYRLVTPGFSETRKMALMK
jgi:hypothetical protein